MSLTLIREQGMVVRALVTITTATGGARRLSDIEADVIRFALEHYGGNVSEAARHLGISRNTIYRRTEERR